MTADVLPFEAQTRDGLPDEPALIVDVEGFEGPLDLLLTLARQQKVDLAKISILALAEQYLEFIEEARRKHLELAADYLVMAAWLAYLKSRLLIPATGDEVEAESAADMAAALALRLRRLEAFRKVATALTTHAQLGRDVFARGMPQPLKDIKRPEWSATLYDLLSAYAVQRRRTTMAFVRMPPRSVWSLNRAREALERLIGVSTSWNRLDEYLIHYVVEPDMRASAFASSLAVTLELVREGVIDVNQGSAFAPIYLRRRADAIPEPSVAAAFAAPNSKEA
jgi:segregation and condensation protein A